MGNAELAAIFIEMAELMELKGGEDKYRVRAFRRIARVLEHLPRSARFLIEDGTLLRTPGIGRGGIERIKEILRTGTCAEHARLRESLPPELKDLTEIKGLGKATIRLAYTHLRVGSIEQLEWAAKSGKLSSVPGLPVGIDARVLTALEEHRQRAGRQPLSRALELGEIFATRLASVAGVERAVVSGSARRRKATVGDLDVLVAAEDAAAPLRKFVSGPDVKKVLRNGENRASVLLESGRQVDVVVRPPRSFGAALHYFTGSQQHNIYLRARGNRLGLKISDKGVFRRSDESLISPAPTEENVFAAVGLEYIPPELRENSGEIEAAARGALPRIISEDELLGELIWRPDEALNFEGILGALDQMRRSWAFILGASGLSTQADRLLLGAETKSLDDLVRLGVEDTAFVRLELRKSDATRMTEISAALESGLIDLVAFEPMSLLESSRAPTGIDFEAILEICRRTSVAIELCSNAETQTVDSVSAKEARSMGVPVFPTLGRASGADLLGRRFDVFAARRGWLTSEGVMSAWSYDHIRSWQSERRVRRGLAPVRLENLGPLGLPVSRVEGSEPTPTSTGFEIPRELLRELENPSESLRARLTRFLEEALDPELERALIEFDRALGREPNAVQCAFSILFSAGRSEDVDTEIEQDSRD